MKNINTSSNLNLILISLKQTKSYTRRDMDSQIPLPTHPQRVSLVVSMNPEVAPRFFFKHGTTKNSIF